MPDSTVKPVIGDIKADFTKFKVTNYLNTLGQSDRFTGTIINKTYQYYDTKPVDNFDENKPQYLIRFMDDKPKVHGWFMKTFQSRVFIDVHEGKSFGESVTMDNKAPVIFTIIDAVPRCYMGTDTHVTSQMCWDFKKLEVNLGLKHVNTFKHMSDASKSEIGEAYDALIELNMISYIKEKYMDMANGVMTADAIKKFVICDLVIKVDEYRDL